MASCESVRSIARLSSPHRARCGDAIPILGIPRALAAVQHVAEELTSQNDLAALPDFSLGFQGAVARLLPGGLLRQRLGREPILEALLLFVPPLGPPSALLPRHPAAVSSVVTAGNLILRPGGGHKRSQFHFRGCNLVS